MMLQSGLAPVASIHSRDCRWRRNVCSWRCVTPGSIEFPGGVWDQARQGNPDFYQAILATIPAGRMGTPDEVADVVAFLLSENAFPPGEGDLPSHAEELRVIVFDEPAGE